MFHLGKKPKFTCEKFGKQIGPFDCGLFAIAAATALAFGINPVQVRFEQTAMRNHLFNCFETGELEVFPTIYVVLYMYMCSDLSYTCYIYI